MLTRRRVLALGATGVAAAAGGSVLVGRHERPNATAGTVRGPAEPPLVYSTDLSHPHFDPDDHFDLACAHGLGLDVRAVVLDAASGSIPGVIPVSQLNAITGRSWQAATGLPAPRSILAALHDAGRPVVIVTTGSCRDVAAAYNLDPDLFAARVERLVVFAGDASATGFVENNVRLAPFAFLQLMGSGLPVRWVPCFDGGLWQAGTHSSYVRAAQADLFPSDLAGPLLRYFSYMLSRATDDPIAYLSQPVSGADLALLRSGERNLWAGILMGAAPGDGSVRWDGRTVGAFEPVTVRFAMTGTVDPRGPIEARVERWRVVDPVGWQQAMIRGTAEALRKVPVV